MPSVPGLNEETICEINREFLTRQLDSDDTAAQEQYSKILGRVFPALPFKVRPIPIPESGAAAATPDAQEGDLVRTTAAAVEETLDEVLVEPLSLLQKLGSLFLINSDPGKKSSKLLQALSWHKHRLILALVASSDHVLVIDYEQQPEGLKSPLVLSHESHQRGVEALEWRPNSGSTLAVGCKGGVCLWTSSYQGTIPPVRTGSVSLLGSPTRPGTKWSLVDFLAWGTDLPVSALSWSPCGRLLACGSSSTPTFAVWDVSLGESTPLRRGMAGVQLLKWSPLGDYLLSAKVDGSFHLWETMSWTSEPWNSAHGGAIIGAAWSPESRMLLSAFEGSSSLGTLHFAGKPPSLEVHLLPLELPEIGRVVKGGWIDRVAWDGSGERLAVSFGGGGEAEEVNSGLIGVYDTRRSPIISASLLGFVRGPGGRPVCFGFHDRLKQGALLGVLWSSGVICVYPLLFRTH